MTFLSPCSKIEAWLREASSGVRPLSQREYQEVTATWRAQFEGALAAGHLVAGAQAEQSVRALLPRDVFVFSMPGYEFLPSPTDPKMDPVYGYAVDALETIDFAVANTDDAILVDSAMSFSCLCTHEAGAFAEPTFVLRGETSHDL
jgi:hypothetical protein